MRSCREIRHADLITAHDPRKLARCVATLWECLFEQGRQSAAQSDGASRCKGVRMNPGMARTGRRRIIEATKKRWAAKRTTDRVLDRSVLPRRGVDTRRASARAARRRSTFNKRTAARPRKQDRRARDQRCFKKMSLFSGRIIDTPCLRRTISQLRIGTN